MNAPIVIHSAPHLLLRDEAERLRNLFGADVVIHDWQGVPLRGATLAITHRRRPAKPGYDCFSWESALELLRHDQGDRHAA